MSQSVVEAPKSRRRMDRCMNDETELPLIHPEDGDDMAATLITFGRPILGILPRDPEPDAVHEVLTLTVSAWNAHALAMDAWGQPDLLDQLRSIVSTADAPRLLVRSLEILSDRRQKFFPDDPRVVETWELREDRVRDGLTLSCSIRCPSEA